MPSSDSRLSAQQLQSAADWEVRHMGTYVPLLCRHTLGRR